MGNFLGWGLAILSLIVGLVWGRHNEKKHYRKLIEREQRLSHILVFNERVPSNELAGRPFYLVSGSIVISSDHFKAFVASLKGFFGGRLSSYEAMMDIGRREAIIRMKEDAVRYGATMIFNVRIETSMLNEATSERGLPNAELFAYGTAWVV